MGFIAIYCPRTGREVSTGIESDRDGFQRLRPVVVRMKCPACGSEHVWSKATARLVEPVVASTQSRSRRRTLPPAPARSRPAAVPKPAACRRPPSRPPPSAAARCRSRADCSTPVILPARRPGSHKLGLLTLRYK